MYVLLSIIRIFGIIVYNNVCIIVYNKWNIRMYVLLSIISIIVYNKWNIRMHVLLSIISVYI